MMMKNLTTLLMKKIGYCKQEENIQHLLLAIPQLLQNQDKLLIKSWQVLEKAQIEKILPILHSRLKCILMVLGRSLYIAAKSQECEKALDPEYTPTNAEKDLFEAKQVCTFS